MDNKILTIAIAAYNVEKYIENALYSICDKKVINDIEVLVVDDGAKDNSLAIAKKFENLFPNSIKAIHKENGGYGSVVDYCIKHARGKYFKLLDGDDYFDREGLTKLVDTLKKTDVDVVFTKFCRISGDKVREAIQFDDSIVDKEIDISEVSLNYATPMHAITFKTDILKDTDLEMPKHLLYTDNIYVAKPLKLVKKALLKNVIVYNYRVDVANQSVNRASLVKHIGDSETISLDLVSYFEKCVKNSLPLYDLVLTNIASTCVNHVAIILKLPISERSLSKLIEFDNNIKAVSTVVYDKMARLDRKCSFVLKLIRTTNYLLYYPLALFNKYF